MPGTAGGTDRIIVCTVSLATSSWSFSASEASRPGSTILGLSSMASGTTSCVLSARKTWESTRCDS